MAAQAAAFERDIHHDPKQKPQKVCVLGGGNFGTAMAFLAASKSHSVRWYCRDATQAATINTTRRNPRYLSDIELPEGLQATANGAEALQGADLVISALPAQATPHFIEKYRGDIPADAIFCCTSKGLYLEEGCFLSEAMLRAFQRPQTLAFLSGPSFARQICERHPTALVCASAKLADAVQVQFALSSKRFRVYASQDTVGVELGGALKNPLAIGAGMIEGAGFGINTLAAFVARRVENNVVSMTWNLHAIDYCVDGVGRLKFDVHTGHASHARAHRFMCGHGRAAGDDLGLGGCR
jgi:glycerol-3-phosphate dehydrogenase (NAD+)